MQARGSAIIGRDDELRVIESALAATRDGRGGTVFVVGEPGIGKSRLATAAADLGFAAGMTVMRGRGSGIGPMVPFRPLTEALMSLLRSGQPGDVSALGPYRPILARLVPDWGPASAGDGSGSPVMLAEGMLRLTALAGQPGACLLVLDDLQDADAETLAVIEYLADNLTDQPTMLLGTVRAAPSPALTLARAMTRRNSSTTLAVGPLAEPQVGQLTASYLGAAPAEVSGQLTEYVWVGSAGVPLMAVELLEDAITSGLLVRGPAGWQVTGGLEHRLTGTLARTIGGRLDLVGPAGRELLALAAVLGQRFPFDLLRGASGLEQRELLSLLNDAVIGQLVTPDEDTPDWYAFQHPLIAEALLSLLSSARQRELAARAADAVEATYPGVPGQWCQAAAALRLRACDSGAAGRLFCEAGRRARQQGAASSAVALLDKALELLTAEADAPVRADAFAARLYALVEAGQVEQALASAAELDQVTPMLDPAAQARLHTRLAWAAMVGGRPREGLAQVAVARRLLGPDATEAATAPVDIVEAHLTLDVPGPGQLEAAELLARRAARAAEAAGEPEVACQAWQLLGALTRSRDPREATACLEYARRLAVRYNLPIQEIHALIRLGNDDALRDGSTSRLQQVRAQATQVGAVTARYQAEASIALQAILRSDWDTAGELLDQVLAPTIRLRLLETTRYALLLQAVLAAHRARRRDMDAAFAQLRHWEGDHAQHTPRAYGLARAWCALLEENRPRALRELAWALAAERKSSTIFQLTGRYGLNLLLRALTGEADLAEYEAIAGNPASRLRWDRQFSLFARAVLVGRAGQPDEAAQSVAAAVEAAAPYPAARHLGLRLVAEAALTDQWGTPAPWLHTSEEYFHGQEIPAVAGACRALLRRSGAPVAQRRRGTEEIPARLRAANVTVREYEALLLIVDRLSNREIAARLHLSPRTVEKHVASLLIKLDQPNRVALADFATGLLLPASTRRLPFRRSSRSPGPGCCGRLPWPTPIRPPAGRKPGLAR